MERYDLCLANCRQKQGRDHLTIISYDDTLCEVTDQIEGSAPRKFVHLLRHAQAHKVVCGLHHFDPEELRDKR